MDPGDSQGTRRSLPLSPTNLSASTPRFPFDYHPGTQEGETKMRIAGMPGFLFAFWAVCFQQVVAQQSAFQWGFNTWTSTVLPQCVSLDLFVDETAGTVKPTPPYYLIAYEAEGLSTWSFVGSQKSSLNWTVNHLTGSSLLIGMVDANGNSGGILQSTYTVAGQTTGSNATCIPSTSSSPITVTSNATSSLDTCDSVQLSIKGGTPPYTVTIAETNTVNSFNNSMADGDDTYVWVNNLSPGGQVIVAVSDSTDSYGKATPVIALTGSTNTRCSTQSRSFSSSNNGSDSNGPSNSSSSKTPVIAGVVVAVLVLGMLGLIAWFFLVWRRRNKDSAKGVRSSKAWNIDHDGAGEYERSRENLAPVPGESDVTPYRLPPTAVHPAGVARSTRSIIGEEMLASEGGIRDSSYWTDGGYYDEDSHTPNSTQGFTTHPPSVVTFNRGDDPFLSPYDTAGSRRFDTTSEFGSRLGSGQGDPAPAPNQAFSITSSAAPASRRFRTLNPDLEDTSAVWSRDTKVVSGTGLPSGSRPPSDGTERPVFQHQDAGAIEEIPPAYPGPGLESSMSGGSGAHPSKGAS